MPKKTLRARPKYTLHRATGQARVRINGKDHYLGEYGSPSSRDRYEQLMREWFDRAGDVTLHDFTVDDLALLFMQHAEEYYRKDGEPTYEVANIRCALRPLVQLFGNSRVADIRPADMKRIRERMIDDGIVRTSINRQIGRIKRAFRWGVEEGYVPAHVLAGVTAISGLRAGRSKAIEADPVTPVSIDAVEAVKPFCSRQVWGMIQLQLATGMRPGEVVQMRGRDLNMAGDVWEYTPASHKTQHHGKRRVIFVGPMGQDVIQDFLKTDLTAYLFSPADARAEFDELRKANRKTKMTPSQRARRRKTEPKKTPGVKYTVASYGQAVRNACELAFGMPDELRRIPKTLPEVEKADRRARASAWRKANAWHPHQLRHTRATELRRQFGIEAARVVLGHTSASVTEVYAELDHSKAREVMAKIG